MSGKLSRTNNNNSNNNHNSNNNDKNHQSNHHENGPSKKPLYSQPQVILLVIIMLQGCFMVFMSLQGPSNNQSRANVAPRGSSWQQQQQQIMRKRDRSSRMSSNNNNDNNSNNNEHEPPDQADKTDKRPRKANTKTARTRAPKTTTPPQYESMIQTEDWDVGAQAFTGALHLHFAQERIDPSFLQNAANIKPLQINTYFQSAEEVAQSKMVRKRVQLKTCHYYYDNDQETGGHYVLRNRIDCFARTKKKSQGIVAYNPLSYPRTWCGKTIKPNSVQHYQKWCNGTEPSRVLLSDSDRLLGSPPSRKDLKALPTMVFRRNGSDVTTVQNVQDCDVGCKFTMDVCQDAEARTLKGERCLPSVSDWTVDGTDFKFKYSMLDPRDEPSVAISRKAYREHLFYATRSFQSEIPLSTFDWDLYGLVTPKNDFVKAAEHGMCFIRLEPCSGEVRPQTWINTLQETFQGNFDNYGPCKYGNSKLKETELDMTKAEDRQSIMGQYIFTLIIGYSTTPDNISELIWDALAAGSIPVYHGAPNVREHVPPNSIILGSEYPSREVLAEYLDTVRSSKEEWEKYHACRDHENGRAAMEEKYEFLKGSASSSYCRMCRWALAAQYNIPWNPQKQAFDKVPPALDKKLCLSKKQVLKKPFEELWTTDMGVQQANRGTDCSQTFAFQRIVMDEVSLDRTLTMHDNGVIDIAVTNLKSMEEIRKVLLKVDFRKSIQNVDGGHIIQPHRLLLNEENPSPHIPLVSSIAIQDKKTRCTILTNWKASLTTPKKEGVVDILIKDLKKSRGHQDFGEPDPETGYISRTPPDEMFQIRFILEDVNLQRDVATEYSVSPFARRMMEDFLDPLMFFQVLDS